MPRTYIVAHNRDRDFYQLAASVAEVDALACLVTDYYVGAQPLAIPRLAHRSTPLIPPDLVRSLPSTVALQALRGPLDRMGIDTIHAVNRSLGRAARTEARRRPGADLLIYSTYAREAFEDPQLADREKTLFMFHPHPTLIGEILAPDVVDWGIGQSGLQEETGVAHRVAVLDAELAAADRVLCASALTRRSVVRAGVPEDRVHVTPYGTARPMPAYREIRPVTGPMRFLFVGQAIHRKGVHHLLAAWRSHRPEDAVLTMVCSRAQDGLLDDLPPGLEVKSGLSSAQPLGGILQGPLLRAGLAGRGFRPRPAGSPVGRLLHDLLGEHGLCRYRPVGRHRDAMPRREHGIAGTGAGPRSGDVRPGRHRP
ncbi:hypothetical protein FALB51S_00093 [Frigidibacter albus]